MTRRGPYNLAREGNKTGRRLRLTKNECFRKLVLLLRMEELAKKGPYVNELSFLSSAFYTRIQERSKYLVSVPLAGRWQVGGGKGDLDKFKNDVTSWMTSKPIARNATP